jgi:hypothetical protein
MPRELLLALILLAILLNVGLLLAIVLVRAGQTWPREWRRGTGHRPSSPPSPIPGPEPESHTAPPPPARPLIATPVVAVPAPAAAAGRSHRPRRFVMPSLEEGNERASRAIEAVIGDPGHRPRRRSRRHRAPGNVDHTTVDAQIVGIEDLRRASGEGPAVRLASAVSTSISSSIRSTDHLIDLGGGRLRIVVQADPAGAAATADRLDALTAPWLAAAVVPVKLGLSVGAVAAPAEGAAAS